MEFEIDYLVFVFLVIQDIFGISAKSLFKLINENITLLDIHKVSVAETGSSPQNKFFLSVG